MEPDWLWSTFPIQPVQLSSQCSRALSLASLLSLSKARVPLRPENDLYFVALDYTNPASPSQVKFVPGTGGVFFQGSISCDLDGTNAAVADAGSGSVYLFSISGGAIALLGKFASPESGITTISISGTTVAVSSSNDTTFTLVSFQNAATPSGTTTQAGLGGGVIVKVSGGSLLAGAILGTNVSLSNVSGTTATSVSTINSQLASIATLGFTRITPVSPTPGITVIPSSLNFGAVRVGSTSSAQALTIKNTGTANLNVSALHTGLSQYVATPSGILPPITPGHSSTVQVRFTPSAVQSYPTSLSMTTNAPTSSVSIPLTGSGGFPHAVVPGPIGFGDVAVCLSHVMNATISNSGPVALTVSAITTTGSGFSTTVTSLQVSAGGSNSIPVTFKPTANGPASGTLSFSTDDPTTTNATIALNGVGTPEPPPSISVSPSSINFGAVPLQYFAGIAFTVANTGPCEDLTVHFAVTGSVFVMTTGNPTTFPNVSSPTDDTIPHSTSKSYTALFGPTAAGSAIGSVTITTNDPANPSVNISLSGVGTLASPAAIELILDRSGSMATPVTGGTRMTALQSAVAMFAELIIPGTGFELGSVQFDTTEAVLTPLANFDVTQQNAIIAGVNSLFPRDLTSIGGGLQLGQTSLAMSSQPRKVAIVFTDGYENTPPMIANVEPAVISAGTEVYAVGLGDPVFLSTAALGELAASSNGKFFQTTDTLVLRKQFVEILADAFRQNMAADPILDLRQGRRVSVPVNITSCESRISFVILWEDLHAQIQFTVRAPDGTTFATGASTSNRLVRESQKPGYRFFQIAFPPGPNGNIGPAEIGTWQMLIDPVFIPGGTTRASTSVLTEGEKLRMSPSISGASVGQAMTVSVSLTHTGTPITGAIVSINITAPTASLSTLSTPLVQRRAAAADTSLIPPCLQHITKTCKTGYIAKPNPNSGAYVLSLPPLVFDGVYTLEISATGNSCGGVFQRFWSGSVYVGPNQIPIPQ